MNKLLSYLNHGYLFLDGGMGTLLQEAGLAPGELPETWSITHPDVVREIHLAYYRAGSNVVSTNTFGANVLKFEPEELERIISASVSLAKEARDAAGGEDRFVALDIGPTGRLLEPFGDLAFEEAVAVFAETVKLGVKYGVDLIFIETMNDSYETKAALLAAKENSSLPVFVSNAYGEDGKLMTGAEPEAMAALLEGMGADAIGMNCSLGPAGLAPVAERLLAVSSVPVILKPNAGLPRDVEGRTVFDVSPEEFAREVCRLMEGGVRVVGGCCGTTPEYISALASHAVGLSPAPVTEKHICSVSSYAGAVRLGELPVLIGERINPTGKKRLKEALLAGDMDYIISEAVGEEEKGAHILDVNVGLPGIDEAAMLLRAVKELQAITPLPLQIDTSDPVAMEGALRAYNGKAMINSVNGKDESMDAVFPLAKKYGGVVVALTLDGDGIPDSPEGRLKIAEKILRRAEEYGIKRHDIIFDPLAMTVSADNNAAKVTLRSLELIREKTGCLTTLGVSNVSFGLPCRDTVTTTFFTCAMERGLSAAIMNPHSEEMMRAYKAYLALHGMDESCMGYIGFMESRLPLTAAPGSASAAPAATGEAMTLRRAIVKGMKDKAAVLCAELLRTTPPLEAVQSEIIPALDEVGISFEEKRTYLPQLLMSAEAAQSAFAVVREAMSATGESEKRCTFVLATVKGDIHDIGKNIVKLLLENYGFDVRDLGRDVSPREIADAVVATGAPIAGLSALMTTTVPAMAETIALLREVAPHCRIVVGGAVLNEEYAAKIGADRYAADAMETVRYALSLSL